MKLKNLLILISLMLAFLFYISPAQGNSENSADQSMRKGLDNKSSINERIRQSEVEQLDFVTGETTTFDPAGKSSWQDMLNYQASHPVTPVTPRVVPFPDPPGPNEIMVANGLITQTPESTTASLSPLGILDSFLGLEDNNASIPPDTMGAAGPDHLMIMLNTQVRVQNKTGGNVSTVTLDTFWTSGTGLSGDPFDPNLIYDSLSDRWMATVFANAASTSSEVWFAISDTSDPTGNWTFYGWDLGRRPQYWADFPGFGMNSTWVAITANMFQISTGNYGGVQMWVIDKASALAGGSLTSTSFSRNFDVAGGYGGFSLKPAVTFDTSVSTLYIVDGNNYYLTSNGAGLLRLSQITGTGSSPSWSVLPGSTVVSGSGFFVTSEIYNVDQVDASQLGTSTKVDTNDSRTLNAVFRDGRLWTTHSAGYPRNTTANSTVAVWYEINPGGMPNPIIQSGVVGGDPGTHYFFPSIGVNANNDVVLGFSYSDSSQYVEGAFTGRMFSDGAGTMREVTTCKVGEDSYTKDFGSGRVRWGDYSATVVDPVDDLTFWTLQEYAETDVGGGASDDRWGTWWCSAQVDNYEIYLPLIIR